MNDKKISSASLIITGLALIVIVGMLIYEKHHLVPFVPTPPPQSATTVVPTYDDTDPTADTGDTSTQPVSVCYYINSPSKGTDGNDVAFLKITVGNGTSATGELGTAIAGKDVLTGTLEGSIGVDSNNSGGYVFDGQYTNSGEGMNNVDPVTLTFDSTHAVDNGFSIPRVDCTQYDSLRGNTARTTQ